MELGLVGTVAIVTGGAKGIGRAVVTPLAREGARVVNVNRLGPEAAEVAQEVVELGAADRYRFFAADLSDAGACGEAIAFARESFGRVDILVNNAGVNDSVGIAAGTTRFVESLQRNLVHYYGMVHYAEAELRKNRGAIVNIGSKVSVTGQGGTSAYAAAKGAINSLTREWAVDFAKDEVRVNAVIPAETWTPLYDRLLGQLPDPTRTKRAIEQLIPLGRRFTTCQEIAEMVVFLASPRSSHTTGQIIFVDGGYTHLDRKYTASGV